MLNDDILNWIYKKYSLIYDAHKNDPVFFSPAFCTRELTAILGGRSFSWRVIGITTEALLIYKSSDFVDPKLFAKTKGKPTNYYKIQRAHIRPRIETTKELLRDVKHATPESFIEYWLKNDCTILCGPGENKKQLTATWLPISNDQSDLFTSNQVGFKYRIDKEGIALRNLI